MNGSTVIMTSSTVAQRMSFDKSIFKYEDSIKVKRYLITKFTVILFYFCDTRLSLEIWFPLKSDIPPVWKGPLQAICLFVKSFELVCTIKLNLMLKHSMKDTGIPRSLSLSLCLNVFMRLTFAISLFKLFLTSVRMPLW